MFFLNFFKLKETRIGLYCHLLLTGLIKFCYSKTAGSAVSSTLRSILEKYSELIKQDEIFIKSDSKMSPKSQSKLPK